METLLPAWGAVALWLANPYQLREFLLYVTSVPKPHGLYERLVEGYLLQGRFLLTDWSASAPAALVTAAGLAYGLFRLRRPGTLLYTLAAVAVLVVSANLRGGAESRIMMWVLPPLWVLVGLGVNEGIEALARRRGLTPHPLSSPGRGSADEARHRGGSTPLALSALALGLVLLGTGNVAAGMRQARAEISAPYMPHLWELLDYVSTHVSPQRRIAMVDCWGRGLPPNGVKWAYLARWGREGLSYDDLNVWEWPMLPKEAHPLRVRWPWRARLPAPPPGSPPADAARLRDADVNALLVWAPSGKVPPAWKTKLLRGATQRLGFREVGDYTAPGDDLRLVVYLWLQDGR